MGGEVVDHQWANIHQDMLNEIAKRIHSYDDYLQLRLVCKQWNFKLQKIPNNKVPWLLLPVEEEEDIFHIKETLDTPTLEEKGIHYLTLPDMQHKLIRGSCYGWLIIVSIHEGTIIMLNPWTNVCFYLPPISSLPNVTYYGDDECIYYYEQCKVMTGTVDANKFLVWKVIINSAPTNDNDFMAVAIYTGLRLAFYKPCNKTWLEIPGNNTYPYFEDVIFFEEKIYAVDYEGQLYEFDSKTSAEPVGGIHEATPPDIVTLGEICNIKYLIGCDDGSLLMIVRHLNMKEGQQNRRYYDTVKFDIYELKKNSKEWSRIISLGNYVLIVGFNASVQMLASEFSNCKGNQIYFTDNLVEEQTLELDGEDYYHGIGVFDLEAETCQTVLSDVKFSCPPVWIFP
ncbi:hypothetical protein PIB30_079449 [Stylosanthes scabra]|uniref:KIB1-4 beta-propeller domain-containing protein n=1 Tax=Stylosanthes scabra TaxID=79078 RepID=A0ABU6ZPR3_9FABA|nr:hypothetical protein [Stylosanthes scabra]